MKTYKTWEDFANDWDLVLFNNCVNLVSQDDTSYFEGVIMEWMDSHNCEYANARCEIEDLADSEDAEDIKRRDDLIAEYGESPECSCEPMQWYAIACGDSDAEFLNETYNIDIFYSEILGLHILPVYHFGTGWSHVNI